MLAQALVATLALGSSDDPVRLVAIASAGDAITGRATLDITLDEDDFDLLIDGEARPARGRPRTLSIAQDVRWTDELLSVEGGKPLALERRFDAARGKAAMTSLDERYEESSAWSWLDERAVAFRWDPDEERFDRAFTLDRTDDVEGALDGLAALVDLSDLLPKDVVEVGESWRVDASALARTLAPLGRAPSPLGESKLIDFGAWASLFGGRIPPVPSAWWDAPAYEGAEGSVVLSLTEVDAEGLARIEVEAEVTFVCDLAPWLMTLPWSERWEADFGSVVVETEVAGQGVLTWDVDGGRAASWSFEGDLDLAMDAALQVMIGYRTDVSARREGSGTVRAAIELERAPSD